MNDWFTIEQIDGNTYVISEYGHREETHMYLLEGERHSLLIDTGLGVRNIHREVLKLTDKPVVAVATHVHWDHIGGHRHFSDFYVHEAEVSWLNEGFPLTREQIITLLLAGLEAPVDFDSETYEFFQGKPTKILDDKDVIDLGGRRLQVLHTPGHAPGHMCFWEADSGYLFTGDLAYSGTLFAHFPSTDPAAYLDSIERVAGLPVKRLFPGHHGLNLPVSILEEMRAGFLDIKAAGKLHHGSGRHICNGFSIQL